MLLLLSVAHAATWSVALDGSGQFASLQAAVDAASDGDVIEVGPGEWRGALRIEGRRLSLRSTDGANRTILDGLGSHTLMRVIDSSVDMEGFTLVNPTEGGIWSQDSILRLNDLVIGGMGYDQADHAALEIDGGSVEVERCTFADNAAEVGGHIHFVDSSLTVLNSQFLKGYAKRGGAIAGDEQSKLVVERSEFLMNLAHKGGAISLGHGSELDISDTTFQENEADTRGGAVVADRQSIVNITGGLFQEQFAKAGAGVVVEDGGLLTVDGTDFEYNTSVGRGGAIWALWGAELQISNTRFVGNSANFGYGGAIQSWGPVTSESNYFKANFSRLWGGGIYVYGGEFSDLNSEFSDNTTTNNYGGAVVVEEAHRMTLVGTQFVQNNASQGGGIAALDAGNLVVRDVVFDDNFARGQGGAMYIYETPTVIEGSTFTENVSGGEGGGIYAAFGSDLSIERCRFSDQKAGGNGGSIRIYDSTSADIRNSRFSWSVSDGIGGSIAADGLSDVAYSLTLTKVDFNDSVAAAQGGTLAVLHMVNVALQQVSMVRSEAGAESFGGAAYFEGIGELQSHNGRYTGNTAGYGGAVYTNGIWSASEQWTNNIFDDNHALYGGAICLVNGEGTRFWNNTLIGNSAEIEAGAVCFHRNAIDFRNNVVMNTTGGAALHAYALTGQESVLFNDWWNNEAGDAGGNWSSVPGDRNMQEDPQMTLWNANDDPEDDMLLPVSGSPIIDAGDPYLKDADGSRSDMGAIGGSQFIVEDADGDGINSQFDCDDHNARIYPGAAEVDYDGIDQDCSGGESDDIDGDGLVAKKLGGTDCNDQNVFIRECAKDEPAKSCATGSGAAWLGLVGVVLLSKRRK